ncbi:MAG: GDSL-type esterase/lipase family protein [Candidatus Hinthialibacter sp.]
MPPLVLIEIIFRIGVSVPVDSWSDPYITFEGLQPLFVLDSSKTHYETAENRLEFFRKQSFPAQKEKETLRIFCLGGSTVQGRPYSVETAFPAWLQLNLQAAQPQRRFEVINCGGVSYASYRLIPIMEELLHYSPDLFILYTGHNEFLEDRTYRSIKQTPRLLTRLHHQMTNLRAYSWLHRAISNWRAADIESASKAVLPTEVHARLDLQDGLDAYHRDDAWRQNIMNHFQRNLEVMMTIAEEAGVPVILINPTSNLKDCPPIKSELRSDLSQEEKKRFQKYWDQAERAEWSAPEEKWRWLKKAQEIDAQHAGVLYLMGKCFEIMGRLAEAKEWLLRAKEADVCPLRILGPMQKSIRDIAEQFHIPLVDVNKLVEDNTGGGIPGNEWLVDHVHPTIQGHQLIADALYDAIQEMGMISTPCGWRQNRFQFWRHQLSSLSEAYYEKGAMRLMRLQKWSRGRIPNLADGAHGENSSGRLQ